MSETYEVAILAGGCFWGMQDLLRTQKGVVSTRVGYCGGTTENPKYNDVKTGNTGHAEAIEIIFDPSVLSFRRILAFFFQIHDPTTYDQQGNDIGSQYRSAIFVTSEIQKQIAQETIKEIEKSKIWPGKIVTEIRQNKEFYEAESAHQDYLMRNPGGYTCHWVRPDWKI